MLKKCWENYCKRFQEIHIFAVPNEGEWIRKDRMMIQSVDIQQYAAVDWCSLMLSTMIV